MTEEQDRILRASVDIDLRLVELWTEALSPNCPLTAVMDDPVVAAQVGAVVRAAYGLGYVHALREDAAGARAELLKTHGFKPE